MSVLTGLEPKNVFRFFEEICAIPHGSHHTKLISDYLVEFARARGLKYRQDEANNVVIFKAATAGYENAPAVMIQGHMDMVCEQDPDCTKDMETEGLDLFVDGDVVGAKGTTLGGDDGIALAMGLAILDSEDIPHGPLECLFTVDEEVGMLGARALDASDLKAKLLLNIDSEEDRVLTVSCAGSTRAACTFPVKREPFSGTVLRVTVTGLTGGHSGNEIHKWRASSNILIGRVLYALSQACETRLIAVEGGKKDNAIPRESAATVAVSDPAAAEKALTALGAALQQEYRMTDPELQLITEQVEDPRLPADADSTRRVTGFLRCVPNGVQAMSVEIEGLTQTSLNMGRLSTEDDSVTAYLMIRSAEKSQQLEVTDRASILTEAFGGTMEIPAAYFAWEYRPDSPLRELVMDAFRSVYGEEPRITAIHGGLECGILSGKIEGLDCISYGPDLTDIHTPRERLHIASTERVWKLTLETLKRLK